jgi:membrane fusion protein (multidrug efflux system)
MTARTPRWLIAAWLLLGAGAWGCGGRPGSAAATSAGGDPDRAAASPEAPREVTTTAPRRAALTQTVALPGTLVPEEEAAVAAQGGGTVLEVKVDAGARVARGAVLVRLDPTKASLAVQQAEAALAQARATFEKARSDLERKRQLLDERTVAPGTFDTFKAQHDAAAAAVEAAETTLRLARQRLAELTVVAPFAGVVKEKRVSPGEYVREGDVVAVVMRVDPMLVRFDVPEKYAARIEVGQRVRASVTAWPGEVFDGRVRRIFPAVAEASRTMRVEAALANPDYRLKPGFFATVHLPVRTLPTSLLLPSSALVRRDGVEHVFVVRNGRATPVRVETGVATAEVVEIVAGVGETDQVVVSGADTLEAGVAVRARPAGPPPP